MADGGATYVDQGERGRRSNPKDEDHRRDPSPDRSDLGEDRGRKARDSGADHVRDFSPKEKTQRRDNREQHRGNNSDYHQGLVTVWQTSERGSWPQRDSDWRSRGGQQGHYDERNQREGRQESFGGRKRRWDYGRNRHNQRNDFGPPPSYDSSGSKRGRYVPDNFRHGQKRHNRFNFKDEDPLVFLSKKLSFILRHGAEKMGFKLMPGGFLWVDDILGRNEYKAFTFDHIKHVVDTNDKKRFSLVKDENWPYKIRANQGHSLEVDGLELTPITDAKDAPDVIHGTYFSSWEIIREQGLNKMNRNHIHFAAGEPGESGVISGMRSSCEVIIKLNMEKALSSGLQFYRSANNVILSPGDSEGFIRPCYFDSAFQRYPRSKLPFNNQIQEGPSIPGLSKEMLEKSKKGNKKKNKGKGREQHPKEKKNDEREPETNMEAEQHPNEKKNDEREPETNMEAATSGIENEDVGVKAEETKTESPQAPVSEHVEEKMVADKGSSSKPQEVPENWDAEIETDKSENAQSSNEPKEFTIVTEKVFCPSAVDLLKEGPVFVYCHLRGGDIDTVSCVSRQGAYNFIRELLDEGDLRELLTAYGPPTKIYNSVAASSKALFDQCKIILDGTEVFDNSVAYADVKDQGKGNFNELPSEFDWQPIGDLKVGAELLQKCLVSLKAYDLLSRWVDKKFKKHLFEEVNKEIDPQELKAEKENRKAMKKKQTATSAQQESPKNQGQKDKKKKKK
uniref:2'-phosphotransferase n=1 Tax=Crassostrea virginica TaxID=6565 RepID=A0A8B8DRZ4_CRAVI|nr:LOW QUALITY PROTEIN: uncharacterized protein LOC111128435 [Crassostrea virginica]